MGTQDEYTAYRLVLQVCQDRFRRVWSTSDFVGPEDQQAAESTEGLGAQQIAYALLTEALRRELYVDAIIQLSKEPGFLNRYQAANEDSRREMEAELALAAQETINRSLVKMAPGCAREVMAMLLDVGGADAEAKT